MKGKQSKILQQPLWAKKETTMKMEQKNFPSANSATATRPPEIYGADLKRPLEASRPVGAFEALDGPLTRPLSDAEIAKAIDFAARVRSAFKSAVPGGWQPGASRRLGLIKDRLQVHFLLLNGWKKALSASDRWEPILPFAKTDQDALMMVAATLKPNRRDRDRHRARFLTMNEPSYLTSHWPDDKPNDKPSDEEPLEFGEKELANATPRTVGQALQLEVATMVYVGACIPPDHWARQHKWTRKIVEAYLEPEFALLAAWRKMHPDWTPRLPLPRTDGQAVMTVAAILHPSDEDKELNRQFLAEGAKS